MQLNLLPVERTRYPRLEVYPLEEGREVLQEQLMRSGLGRKGWPVEVWTSSATTQELRYSTHGLYRFFGKFPPPIPRHLLMEYCGQDGPAFDAMCGSGTTGVEALLLGQISVLADINPLAVLLTRVKTRHLPEQALIRGLEEIENILQSLSPGTKYDPATPGLRNANHWFLLETIRSLARIRFAVETAEIDEAIRDFFKVVFASIVRRASRATTQQGRLFLDAATAVKDAEPLFLARAREAIPAVASLPQGPEQRILLQSTLDPHGRAGQYPLIICHPPYYNSYRYSGINSLELAWLRIDHNEVRKGEIREAFKLGRPEKVTAYVDDMVRTLENLGRILRPTGVLALMIGDTVLRGKHIPVTRMVLDRLASLQLERVAVRVPRYTEASWVASQRRTAEKLGVNLCDYVILLRKR